MSLLWRKTKADDKEGELEVSFLMLISSIFLIMTLT